MVIYKEKSVAIDIFAAIVIICAGIIMLYLWKLNPEFRTLYVGEPFVDANQFIPGSNFNQVGFVRLRFTADYAIGPAQYHPFYYTHNPPLSEIINGLYQKFGLVRIEWQRPICIVWTLLGFLFFYAMLRLFAGSIIALGGLIIAITNPYVIYWGDNLFASHQWMFVYASLYFFLQNIRKSSPLFFSLAWISFFCASFSNYELIPFIAFFALGLKIFRIERIPLRNVFIFLLAPLVAFCLRNLLVIWAVGYSVWIRDLVEILLHRTLGITTHFMEIYKKFPVIIWNPYPVLPKNYLQLLYYRLENLYGFGWSLIFILFAFPTVRHRLLLAKAALLFRLILLFFMMGIIWYILFPQQTSEHFHSHTMLLFLPFACLIWSSAIIGLWQNVNYAPIKAVGLSVILCAIISARVLNFVPPKPFPGIDMLKNYEGKVFCTNVIPSLVEYYTKAPAAFCGYEEQFKDLRNGKYYFFLRNEQMPAPSPEFFFSVYGDVDQELAPYFPVVQQGDEYIIYRLKPKSELVE